MKKLSVKMKITLWYTGLIVIILSAIFTAVLLATDKVLLLGVQNKLEEEVYDFAEELKVDSNGRLRLEKLDFLKDGVRLAVYHENGQMITGLVASGLPETPFADELLQKAETTAVFQLESRGMKELIKKLKPDCLEDLIALVALFRPGPLQSGMVDDFINRKHGRAELAYPHPDYQYDGLQPVLARARAKVETDFNQQVINRQLAGLLHTLC